MENVLKESLEHFLKFLSLKGSVNTVEAYKNDINAFLSFFKEKDFNGIKDLSFEEIQKWLSYRYDQEYSKRSTIRAISSLKSFFKYLKNKKVITDHNFFYINRMKMDSVLPRAINNQEIPKIFNKLEKVSTKDWTQKRDVALFYFLYQTGVRISEALNLNNVDLGEYISILGKGGKKRIVPVLPQTIKLVKEYMEIHPHCKNKNSPLFYGEKGGRFSPVVAARQIQRLKEFMGLPEFFTPHSFRHSCATHLLENGANLREIQKLLGHSSINTTQIYFGVSKKKILKDYLTYQPRG